MAASDKQPTVLLGVTGCIAAYKSCYILRGLQKAGVRVKVVMTEHACEFVGPTTFRALSGEEVAVELFDEPGAPVHHVSLAQEADLFVIAPATANAISKIARGQADDLLTTTAVACKAPLLVAPAMNTAMWENTVTQENVAELARRGVRIVSPASGYLACGTTGTGRMEEPEVIVEAALEELSRIKSLEGKRVLITAGPTQEPIDPVRCITNHSSGITGYQIAEEAARRGAKVTLVSGPVSLEAPAGVELVKVKTACEMLEACREPYENADAAIFVAAVSDWRVADVAREKIKHDGSDLTLTLVPNPDIAATLGANKGSTYQVVFAAETGHPVDAARKKLVSKNADLCVANDVSSPSLGFGTADNHVWLVDAQGAEELPVLSKREIATHILDRVGAFLA